MVRKKCLGSTVVEMAYLMPVVLLTWMLIIFALFYYHDKNILAGAAYETVVVGSELMHEEKEPPVEKIESYFRNRINNKMLFFRDADIEVVTDEEEMIVRARASAKGLVVGIEKKAAVTVPEKKIRKIRKLKQKIERNISG